MERIQEDLFITDELENETETKTNTWSWKKTRQWVERISC